MGVILTAMPQDWLKRQCYRERETETQRDTRREMERVRDRDGGWGLKQKRGNLYLSTETERDKPHHLSWSRREQRMGDSKDLGVPPAP